LISCFRADVRFNYGTINFYPPKKNYLLGYLVKIYFIVHVNILSSWTCYWYQIKSLYHNCGRARTWYMCSWVFTYMYLCNQCLSPQKLQVQTPFMACIDANPFLGTLCLLQILQTRLVHSARWSGWTHIYNKTFQKCQVNNISGTPELDINYSMGGRHREIDKNVLCSLTTRDQTRNG
jgi:hypothetical protein